MRLLPVLLALALGATSCGPSAPERAFAAGSWEEAAKALEARIALAPPRPADRAAAEGLDRQVRVDFYNLACARARLGRHEPAFDALEQALRDGAWEIGFDHLLRDPDLAPLRGKARWDALVRHLSWNEDVEVGGPEGSPTVVVWIGPGVPGPPGARSASPRPPYLVSPGVHAWRTVLEPGARAAEKAVFAARRGERCILAARGAEFVRVAWEVLLREPTVFSHAVLEGPSPPAWALLDRGAERVKARVLAAGPGSMPPPGLGVAAEDAGSLEEALRRAVR